MPRNAAQRIDQTAFAERWCRQNARWATQQVRRCGIPGPFGSRQGCLRPGLGLRVGRRASTTLGLAPTGPVLCSKERCPPRVRGRGCTIRRAAARARAHHRRGAISIRDFGSPSHVFHFIRKVVERRMAVNFIVGGVKEDVFFGRS